MRQITITLHFDDNDQNVASHVESRNNREGIGPPEYNLSGTITGNMDNALPVPPGYTGSNQGTIEGKGSEPPKPPF